MVILLTGTSGSGKSTIANLFLKKNKKVALIDGDTLRKYLRVQDHSPESRIENCRVAGELAWLTYDTGRDVIMCMESPTEYVRNLIASCIPESSKFFVVYVYASLATCKERDPKGLYAKEARGKLKFPMVGDKYEEPYKPSLVLNTERMGAHDCTDLLITEYLKWGYGVSTPN